MTNAIRPTSPNPLRDRLAQRIVQIGGGDEDGNDANARRRDPLFTLGVERRPLDEAMDLASAPTFSRLENAVSSKDIDRMAQAFVDPFIASDPEAPAVIVIDLDPSEDPTHGQQEFSFDNHYSQSHCDLPLFLFEGLSGTFITAALRPGKRPTGAENAMILKRVLQRLRAAWPDTHFVRRGDAPFANPELMALTLADGHTDFLFGLAGNRVLSPLATPFLVTNRQRHAVREANARRLHQAPPSSTRSYHDPNGQYYQMDPQGYGTPLEQQDSSE
jgi:hypothetical protein